MGDQVVEVPMDEKWKLTKKGSMKCSSSRKGGGEALLRRSDSVPARSSFSRKCATLVKEQRAKFYIVRRCVTMLVCWKDYRDS